MKNKKIVHLLAASWLVAPTLLATQPAFADEANTSEPTTELTSTDTNTADDSVTEQGTSPEAEESVSTDDPLSAESSDTTGSPSEAINSGESADTSTEPEVTYTAKNYTDDAGNKIEFSDKNGTKLIPNSAGIIEGLHEGEQLTYTVTPSDSYTLTTLTILGAQSVIPSSDALSGTFLVGSENLTIQASFTKKLEPVEPVIPEEPEDTTSSSSDTTEQTTPSSTIPSETVSSSESETSHSTTAPSSSQPTTDSGTTSSSKEHTTTTSSSNKNKPSNTTNSSNKNKPSTTTSSANKNTSNKQEKQEPTVPNPITNNSSSSNKDIIKTPIDAVIPTNTTATQQAIVKEAYKYLGAPYVWGAKGPSSFDCSGLAYYVYMKATGHYIGGWTGEQQYAGTQIPVSQAQPGDLLFWGPSTGTTHHVAIYIGNGQYIQAPHPGDVVRITNISDYTPDFAVRVNLAGLPAANGGLGSSILDTIQDGDFNFSQNQTTDEFLEKVADEAQEIGQEEGIYASVMIAQAILESGSGNSSLASEPNYNLFGIKGAFEGKSVSFNTLEQDDSGQSYQIRANFRKYPSYKESLEDYAKLIKNGISGNKDFYKATWKSETDSYEDATAYLQGRYATDKQYAKKLNAIIEAYDLDQYDEAKEVKKINTSTKKSTKKLSKEDTVVLSNQVLGVTDWIPASLSLVSPALNIPTIVTNYAFTATIPKNSAADTTANDSIYNRLVHKATPWDRWYHFSLLLDPDKQKLIENPDSLPLIHYLSLDKSFWFQLPIL
ncbi:MAG: glucosaminidase domain-containing protein [Enterococcus sp.]